MPSNQRRKRHRPPAHGPRPRPRGSAGRAVSEREWLEADAELDRMATALAEMGRLVIDAADDFDREVEACSALAELTLPIWQSHPKALEGFITKLVTHDLPGGRALALVGALFMPGRLGDLLRQARFTMVMVADRASLPEWTYRAAVRPVPTRFLLTLDGREPQGPGLYCLFERGGSEFGWFLGFDQRDCGVPIDFQHVPTPYCEELTGKIFTAAAENDRFEVHELTDPEGRWLLESSLTALESHGFKFSEAHEKTAAAGEAPTLRERIAFTALLRWHLHGGARRLGRALPKHGTHFPFVRW